MVDVSASDSAYWRLLDELWRCGEDFCIVEHDVVVNASTFDELDSCEEAWCSFPHLYVCGGPAGYQGMGCVRFRASVLLKVPDAMERVAEKSDIDHAPKHWCTIDKWLQHEVLPPAGIVRHRHETVLGHLGGPNVSHGCL